MKGPHSKLCGTVVLILVLVVLSCSKQGMINGRYWYPEEFASRAQISDAAGRDLVTIADSVIAANKRDSYGYCRVEKILEDSVEYIVMYELATPPELIVVGGCGYVFISKADFSVIRYVPES